MHTDVISEHLQHILTDEALPFEIPALQLIAKAAQGSMRDALSLLDQAIASSDHHIRTDNIINILGHTRQDYALQLLSALAELDAKKLMAISKQIADEGGNFHYVLEELLNHLHQITVHQCVPTHNPLIAVAPEIAQLCPKFSAEDVQLFYQIGIKGTEEMHLAPTLGIGFEMMLLRMYTFKPATELVSPPLAYQSLGTTKAPAMIETAPPPLPVYEQTDLMAAEITAPPVIEDIATPDGDPRVSAHTADPVATNDQEDWACLLSKLTLNGLARNAAENAEFISKTGREVVLRIARGHQSVFTTTVVSRIEQELTNYFKEPIKLVLRSDEQVLSSPAQQKKIVQEKQHQDAEISLQNDPFFQQLQQQFSAEVVKNSITPLKDDL